MGTIAIELEADLWYEVEWALRMAEMEEMQFAERAKPFLDTAQRERAERVMIRHQENAERYKSLSEAIRKKISERG